MGESSKRQSSGLGAFLKNSSWVWFLHYSRVQPPTNGKRYLTSTAVFFNEVVKLSISLTVALYEVSQSAPPTVAATSLLSSLTSTVFTGDSWKLAIPACLYTLANSLQYIALSNMQAAVFQVTYQLKLVVASVFGVMLLRTSIPLRKWGLLLLVLVGVAIVQLPISNSDDISLQDETMHHAFPRSLEEWKAAKLNRGNLHKRSATYEGIEEDIMTAYPRMNLLVGLTATVGACIASGLAGVYFEKVLKDSAKSTSLWIRNVQLSIYSIFPALFIGVVFLDGEKVAANGFFDGYNWTVWSTVILQAIGGIASSFCIGYAQHDARNVASATSIILTSLVSLWLFEFDLKVNYIIGTFAVIAGTYLCEDTSVASGKRQAPRPPPIRVDRYEKDSKSDETSPASATAGANDFSIKLPTTPFLSDAGLSSSRPTSPGHARVSTSRTGSGGYFEK
ncbi:predicted protein [Aspergillus terreus NIH2624]|uniref:UDP-galactose transporter n=1 Tax=Aspergillus terreus (strain NIH 2624 / FGSC A1156) TaxID=341663 RepID=Q0CSJ7_ASPTN|nr:uncharacterized protein ATEG_03337 [Aspergillus terreus NIH2624]EAU36611.1 predicted protein [Aspergillus terreus NIH2624]